MICFSRSPFRVSTIDKTSAKVLTVMAAPPSSPPAVAISAALKPSIALDSDSVIVRGHDFSECALSPASRNGESRPESSPYSNATDLASLGCGATSATDADVAKFAGEASVDYSRLMSSLLTTGFQATCLGQAIQLVNRMVSCPANRWLLPKLMREVTYAYMLFRLTGGSVTSRLQTTRWMRKKTLIFGRTLSARSSLALLPISCPPA